MSWRTALEVEKAIQWGRRNGHSIVFSGDHRDGYQWSCECGDSDGLLWEGPFDRTYMANEHLIQVMSENQPKSINEREGDQ